MIARSLRDVILGVVKNCSVKPEAPPLPPEHLIHVAAKQLKAEGIPFHYPTVLARARNIAES